MNKFNNEYILLNKIRKLQFYWKNPVKKKRISKKIPKPHGEFFDDGNILGFDSAYQK